MRLAERMQDLSHNYHPYRIRQQYPDLMDRIAAGMAPVVEDPAALWREMYDGFAFDRYADETLRVPANAFDHPRLLVTLDTGCAGDILFSGGGLIPRVLLEIAGLRMIHVHTGFLPHVRGADALLWSLLARGRVGASAFFMTPRLDSGDILAAREFPPLEIPLPWDTLQDDVTLYRALFAFIDPLIRAELLVTDVLAGGGGAELPRAVSQDMSVGRTYHFMHPTLRSRALKKLFVSRSDRDNESPAPAIPLHSYQVFYARPTVRARARFLVDAALTKSPLRRLALKNRGKDYIAAQRNLSLLRLHGDFNRELTRQQECWPSFDYGQGWFYQSSEELGITGLRDTVARLKTYELERRVVGRTVLEIGCNSGFLSLALARYARRVVAFDLNPHLIAIARLGQRYLHRDNVVFSAAPFEDFQASEKFDDVLSFANHHTYDRNTRQCLDDYFARCHALTRPGGRLLFESHPPEIESGHFADVLRSLEQHFVIETSEVHRFGTFLDRNRVFLVAIKRDTRLAAIPA